MIHNGLGAINLSHNTLLLIITNKTKIIDRVNERRPEMRIVESMLEEPTSENDEPIWIYAGTYILQRLPYASWKKVRPNEAVSLRLRLSCLIDIASLRLLC